MKMFRGNLARQTFAALTPKISNALKKNDLNTFKSFAVVNAAKPWNHSLLFKNSPVNFVRRFADAPTTPVDKPPEDELRSANGLLNRFVRYLNHFDYFKCQNKSFP